jgi:quercetin 2,3-dioxygenase
MKLIAAGVGAAAVGCVKGRAMKSDAEAILTVTRLGMPWRTPDPFLFCVHHDDDYPAANDHMGPAASLAGRDIGQDFGRKDGWSMYHGEVVPGFPQHPHRGFETVTLVRRGLLDHSDSMGAAARYGGGDVQWLTAGAGIQHAEMFPLFHKDAHNPVELFQIWLNLPAASKMVQPYFSMFWDQQIPRVETRDANGRVTRVTLVAGALGDRQSPRPPPSSWATSVDADLAIWTLTLSPGAHWTLPAARAGTNRTLYFFRGAGLSVAGRSIDAYHQIDLRPEFDVELVAGPVECELLMLQGRPIGEPVVQYGPFVMNSQAEIRQAFADYQRTQFGGWPWPGRDPVHGREPARFAQHADGRIERPT